MEPESGEANSRLGDKAGRRFPEFVVADQNRPDRRMRTDKGALIALDAVFRLPLWRFAGNAPFFPGRPAQRKGSVLAAIKGANRQPVPLFAVHGHHHIPNECGQGFVRLYRRILGSFPGVRRHDPDQALYAFVDGGMVHVDHRLPLLGVGGVDPLLQVPGRVGERNDRRQLEERRLHDHVDPATQAEFLGDRHRIDEIKLDITGGNIAFHRRRQVFLQLIRRPCTVQDEYPVGFQAGQQVVLMHIGLLVTGDKVGLGDEIGGANRLATEPEVGNGQSP